MVQVAKLVASLFANTSEFEAGMKRASKQWRSFKKESEEAAKKAALGLSATALALTALTIRQAGVIDSQAKLARSIGVSLEKFQALNLVAKEAGVGQDQLAIALRKTQVALFEAGKGSKEIQSAFKSLNLNVTALLKTSPDKQFEKIAEALEKIKNPTEKTALAMKIFGKSGGDIIPILENFSRNLAEAEAFTKKFNLSLSEIDANKVEEANDAFGRVGQAAAGLGNTIAVELSPFVTEFSNILLDNIGDAKTWQGALTAAIDEVAASIDFLKRTFEGVKGGFKVFTEATVGAATTAFASLTGDKELAAEVAKNTAAAIKGTIEETKKQVSKGAAVAFVSNARSGAQSRSVATQAGRPKLDGSASLGGLISETDGQKKFQDSIDGLKKENDLLNLNIGLQGRKASAISAAHKLFEINSAFAKEGIILSKQQTEQVTQQIAKYEELSETYEKVQRAEERRKQLSQDIAGRIDSAFEDAIISGKKLGATLRSLAADLLNMVAKAALKNAFGGITSSIGEAIGGLFGGSSFATGTDFVPYDMTARLHKGERVTTAQMAGGGMAGDVVLNVTNRADATVSAQQRNNSNGVEIELMIDRAVAKNMTKKGTSTNQALGAFSQRSLVRR